MRKIVDEITNIETARPNIKVLSDVFGEEKHIYCMRESEERLIILYCEVDRRGNL